MEELPNFATAGRVDGTKPYTVTSQEFQQKVLPNDFYTGLPVPYNAGTMVFGYGIKRGSQLYPPAASGQPGLYPGFTVVAQRGKQDQGDVHQQSRPAALGSEYLFQPLRPQPPELHHLGPEYPLGQPL